MEKRDGFTKHQVKSFGYAIEGLVYSFQKGLHFRIHILAFILISVLGFILSISLFEWLAVILISSAVISAEALNTAIEETCNLLHPDTHPRAKLAKHCAAGAVLILSIAAVIIGLIIFIPKVLG